jgi:hypothetical protein
MTSYLGVKPGNDDGTDWQRETAPWFAAAAPL